MAESKERPQTGPALSTSLNHRLNLYALAAGTAGVVSLAAAQPAHAEVVFHPTNVLLTAGSLSIDLNDDGLVDFTLHDTLFRTVFGPSSFVYTRRLSLSGNVGASVAAQGNDALALPLGAAIGSSDTFLNANANRVRMANAGIAGCGSSCIGIIDSGAWAHAQNLYLGLKFEINGETHYGWARLSTTSLPRKQFMKARLTAYAYETTANQSITAGQMKGAEVNAALPGPAIPKPAALGALARGAAK